MKRKSYNFYEKFIRVIPLNKPNKNYWFVFMLNTMINKSLGSTKH